MGIKLTKADITAVKGDASAHRPAKPRYRNAHLPFENQTHDLQIWRNTVIPGIIDWAGTLEEPFGVNSHPDLPDIVEASWKEGFPEIPADSAVQAVVRAENMSFNLIITNVINDTGQFCDPQLEEFDWQARSTAARHNIQG
jgi:hypothetical protein